MKCSKIKFLHRLDHGEIGEVGGDSGGSGSSTDTRDRTDDRFTYRGVNWGKKLEEVIAGVEGLLLGVGAVGRWVAHGRRIGHQGHGGVHQRN